MNITMTDPILFKFKGFLKYWDDLSEYNIEYFMELGLDNEQSEAFRNLHNFVKKLQKANEDKQIRIHNLATNSMKVIRIHKNDEERINDVLIQGGISKEDADKMTKNLNESPNKHPEYWYICVKNDFQFKTKNKEQSNG